MVNEQIPYRDQPHYCRECGARFEKNPNSVQSMHAAEYFHEQREHPESAPPWIERCSRYCEQREQFEEAKAGRRLYGKGVDKIPVDSTAYDKMFPDN